MKKTSLLIASLAITVLSSCGDNSNELASLKKENDSLRAIVNGSPNKDRSSSMEWFIPSDKDTSMKTGYTSPIDTQTANNMVDWYLTGTPKLMNGEYVLRSFFFDYQNLKKYLDSTNAKHIQLLIGRKSESGPFTLIFAGVKEGGQHTYEMIDGKAHVYQHCYPCPEQCQALETTYVK